MEFIVAVGTNQISQVSANELQGVLKVFQNRMATIGCPWSAELAGENRISVKIDPEGKEQIEQARLLLTRIGVVEFRLVHEESEKLLRDGIVPPGFEMLNEPRPAATGQKLSIPQLVSKKAVPGMAGQKFSRVTMGRDDIGRSEIMFEFDQGGALAFERVTTENVGRNLAIVLDREICSAPRIAGPISGGRGSITAAFDDQEARMLITILKYPLETPAKLIEERRF